MIKHSWVNISHDLGVLVDKCTVCDIRRVGVFDQTIKRLYYTYYVQEKMLLKRPDCIKEKVNINQLNLFE